MRGRHATLAPLLFAAGVACAMDPAPLWDFLRPELSEERLREALATAQGDDALVLQTQIARTYGLRRDFARARELLGEIEPRVRSAGPEARARWWLETGRTHASATHAPEALTAASKDAARAAYLRALGIASGARLDALAIDALHMMAFVDTAPAEQLKWGEQALRIAAASAQPEAQRWEAALRNNVGYALHQLGRHEEALAQFRAAVELRRRGANAQALRTAQWMVAWTLRALARHDEALALQLALEREGDAAGAPDPHVFEELEILYRVRGDAPRAAHYAERRRAARPQSPP